jgi:hypothetical protein
MIISRGFGQNYCIWKKFHHMKCGPKDDDITGVVMYPLLDLVNHQPIPEVHRDEHFDVIRA